MTSDDIVIHEVARIALANLKFRTLIGEFLDLSNAELYRIQQIALDRLNEGIQND